MNKVKLASDISETLKFMNASLLDAIFSYLDSCPYEMPKRWTKFRFQWMRLGCFLQSGKTSVKLPRIHKDENFHLSACTGHCFYLIILNMH